MVKEISNEIMSKTDTLKFTGNWFLDAGIIGFVNLMEDVYGWDLDELQRLIDEGPEKVYFGYFPFAYLYRWFTDKERNKERIKDELDKKSFQNSEDLFNFVWYTFICDLLEDRWVESTCKDLLTKDPEQNSSKIRYVNDPAILQSIDRMKENLRELDNKHSEELRDILNKKKKVKLNYDDMKNLIESVDSYTNISEELKSIIDKFKEHQEKLYIFLKKDWENNVITKKKIDKTKDNFYRLPVYDQFYINFPLFNPSSGFERQRESFYYAISFNIAKEKILDRIDKTINKFLPSETEFPNINYAKFSTIPFKKQFEYLFVYLLCFTRAFEWYGDKNTFFYSNDMRFTYEINKKLRLYKKRHINSKMSRDIFTVTWQQIIDSLVEYKSTWSLENMYIISYKKLDNQSQEDIEYIGIPKLQASIIIDDSIRQKLNTRIQYSQKRSCWLIEEFIKGRSLYPLLLDHTILALNDGKVSYKKHNGTYGLIIDSKIIESQVKNNKKIFSPDYFDSYRFLVDEIKDEIRYTSFSVSLINEILNRVLNQASPVAIAKNEIKNRIARELLDAIKAKNKNEFLNVLLKNLNNPKGLNYSEFNKSINDWIFAKIINNDINFERYGLILVMNLISRNRGEKNE